MTPPDAEQSTPELPALEALDDAALRALARRVNELLKEREHSRQRDAIERARAILADAGLSVDDLVRGAGKGAAKGARKPAEGSAASANAAAVPKKGARYANPDNPGQVHERGRGREPNWFKALRESGRLPDPLP